MPPDPEPYFVSERFLPVTGAPRHARDVITDACLRWNLPDLVAPAALIVSELIANASEHAKTFMTLEVTHRGSHVHLAVHDGVSNPPIQREPSPGNDAAGGWGLRLVQATATTWGYDLRDDGKIVWATLALDTKQQPHGTRRQPFDSC